MLPDSFIETFSAQLQTAMRTCRVPGAAVAVIMDGQLAWSAGFGLCSSETPELPVTPDTLFRIGSVTKPLTGTFILRCVQTGILGLDDTAVTDPHYGALTYRALLSHTAGLATGLHYYGSRDHHSLLPYQNPLSFVAPPGAGYSYSNVGINLAGNAAAHATNTNTSFAGQLNQQVFTPLGMNRSTFDPLQAATHRLALGHILDKDYQPVPLRPIIENVPEHPCGFAFSTVLDLARFIQMQLDDGLTPNGAPFLDRALLAEMHRLHAPLFTSDNAGYGLALRINTITDGSQNIIRYGHNGAIGKYGAWLQFVPELNAGVVMLCNRAPNFWGAAETLLKTVWDTITAATPVRRTFTVPPSYYAVKARDWNDYTNRTYLGHECGLIHLSGNAGNPAAMWEREPFRLQPVERQNTVEYHRFAAEMPRAVPESHPVLQIAIGLLDHGYIMLNSCLCEPYDDQHRAIEPDPDHAGVYVGDLDTLTVRLHYKGIDVFSMDSQTWTRYHMFTPGSYTSHAGILRFKGNGRLIDQDAFELIRIPR